MIFSPNSPWGRTRRKARASTYANQFSIAPPTSGPQYTSPSFSPTPMMRPPTMAPGTDVKPPRMSTGRDFSAMRERLNCTPLFAPHMMPATMATSPATDHTTTQIVLRGMPMLSAASWSSATARRARPILVFWKKMASTVTMTAAVTAAVISSRLICTPFTRNEVSGMPTSSFFTLAPHTISPNPSRKKLSPMVAMNRMMCSWFTSGRRTTRSMAKAMAIMTRMVRARATGTCAPFSISPTRVRAAKSTITPWAKLKTPEALKISTNPRATSEYMRPAAMPPMSTSVRKVRFPAMSAKGATRTAWSSSIMGHAQVGVHHRLILAHDLGRAVGDLPAVIEHDHAIGNIHDHAHIVLDQRDGGAELVVHVEDEAGHVLLLLHVHPRHGLVEEEEVRLGGQRPRQLHSLLEPVGQPPRRRLADGLDLQEVDHAFHRRAMLDLLPPRGTPVEGVEEEVPAHLEQPPRHDVVEHAHALEEGHVLEGARDAEAGHVERLELGAVASLEDDAALLRMVEAADDIEERGLARPVGADDGHDLAAMDVHAHVAQSLHGAEAHGDALDAQEGLRARPGHRVRRLRAGAGHQAPSTSMIRTWRSVSEVRPSS